MVGVVGASFTLGHGIQAGRVAQWARGPAVGSKGLRKLSIWAENALLVDWPERGSGWGWERYVASRRMGGRRQSRRSILRKAGLSADLSYVPYGNAQRADLRPEQQVERCHGRLDPMGWPNGHDETPRVGATQQFSSGVIWEAREMKVAG